MKKLRAIVDSDEGIGLIEVVVAMFLLALLAVSLLPALITGMKLAAVNTTIAAATQLANDRIRTAQAAAPSCSDVTGNVAGTIETTDERGVLLRATTTVVGDCPPTEAETMKVTTVVINAETGDELATATTYVLVTP